MPSRPAAYVMRCPMCGKPVAYEKGGPIPDGFPFCGERCTMADLGKWLREEYVLGRELASEDDILDEERVGLLRATRDGLPEPFEEDDESDDR